MGGGRPSERQVPVAPHEPTVPSRSGAVGQHEHRRVQSVDEARAGRGRGRRARPAGDLAELRSRRDRVLGDRERPLRDPGPGGTGRGCPARRCRPRATSRPSASRRATQSTGRSSSASWGRVGTDRPTAGRRSPGPGPRWMHGTSSSPTSTTRPRRPSSSPAFAVDHTIFAMAQTHIVRSRPTAEPPGRRSTFRPRPRSSSLRPSGPRRRRKVSEAAPEDDTVAVAFDLSHPYASTITVDWRTVDVPQRGGHRIVGRRRLHRRLRPARVPARHGATAGADHRERRRCGRSRRAGHHVALHAVLRDAGRTSGTASISTTTTAPLSNPLTVPACERLRSWRHPHAE